MSAFYLDFLLTSILTQVRIPFRSSQSLPDVKFKHSSPAFVAHVVLGTTSFQRRLLQILPAVERKSKTRGDGKKHEHNAKQKALGGQTLTGVYCI